LGVSRGFGKVRKEPENSCQVRLFIAFPDGEQWAFCPYLHIAALESVGNGRQ